MKTAYTRSRWCCGALVGLAMVRPVYGQDSLGEISRQIAEFADRSSAQGASSPQQAAAQAAKKMTAFEATLVKPAATSTPDPHFVVNSHFVARQGRPFPKAESVELQPRPTPAQRPTPVARPNFWVAGGNRTSRPPSCGKMETRRVARRGGAAGTPVQESKTIVLDTLYVSPELVALDSSEVYGAVTNVYGYPASPEGDADRVALRVRLDRVPCLPYRIRLTETHAYYHMGEEALRNYDQDPLGPGVLHNWARSRLQTPR